MDVVEDVKHELSELITGKFEGETSVSNVVEYLWNLGVLNKKTALRCLIRSDYYEMIKAQDKGFTEIKYELADKYDVDFDFVKNTIYKYSHIQI